MDGSVPTPSSVYEACARLRPSYLMLWPPTAAAMMSQPPPKEYDLSSVVGVVPIGSSVMKLSISCNCRLRKAKLLFFLSSARSIFKVPAGFEAKMSEYFPNGRGSQGYGLSEVGFSCRVD